jgi:hypothetical protein
MGRLLENGAQWHVTCSELGERSYRGGACTYS